MAEIRNYTMNFGSGPLEGCALALDFPKGKSAFTEIHGKVVSNG
ncbi:MAG TPA: hypothetical protein VFK48_17305 [Usitatibacter sp.]|nr:hypothetical protein [Usitatibacter sp.]